MLDLGHPDDFRGQPYPWLTNQMAHVLVGIAGSWILIALGMPGWGAILAAGLTSGSVEALHFSRGGTLRDGITDLAHVLSGAVWQVLGGTFWLLAIVALELAIGAQMRAAERDEAAHIGDR